MTSSVAPAPGPVAEALRWSLAGALVLAAHVGVLMLLPRQPEPARLTTGGETAMAVDLEPIEGDDAKSPDDPVPETAGDPSTAAAPAAASAGSAGPPPPPDAEPPHDPVRPPPAPDAAPRPLDPPVPAVSRLPDVQAASPPSPPPPVPAPSSAASAGADFAEERVPAIRRTASGAEAAWRGKLVAHLNRFRRFQAGIAGGTARIGFRLDRRGRVIDLRVVTSSGDAALDEAARAIVDRASPFPAPPDGLADAALSFVVPVHFDGPR